VFDPDVPNVGHQPKGYDTVSQAYLRYTVLRSRIKVTAFNNTLSSLAFAINQYTNTGVTASNMLNFTEAKRSKQIMLSNLGDNHSGAITSNFDARSFHGVSKRTDIVSTGEFSGSVDGSSAPGRAAFFYILTAPFINIPAGTIPAIVEIEYDVIFSDPAELPTS